MPMNPNFLCCIGAELKNSTQQTTRMSQIYFYRAFEEETVADMLQPGFFDAAMGIVRKDDLLLLYDPKDEFARWTYCRVSNVDRSGVEISLMGVNAKDVLVEISGEDPITLQSLIDNTIMPAIENIGDMDLPVITEGGTAPTNLSEAIRQIVTQNLTLSEDSVEPQSGQFSLWGAIKKALENAKNFFSSISNLDTRLNALEGQGGPVGSYDFGKSFPNILDATDTQLVAGVMVDNIWAGHTPIVWTTPIANSTFTDGDGVDRTVGEIFNGTWIINSYDGTRIVLTNTPNTTPPIFSYQNVGVYSVGFANATTAGIVRVGTGSDMTVDQITGDISIDNTKGYSIFHRLISLFTSAEKTQIRSDLNAASRDMDDLSATGQNIANWSSNVSNCITNITQDIKLELDTATHSIILKAGSKVYVPNGVDTFDTITIASDLTLSPVGSATFSQLLYVTNDGTALATGASSVSGTSVPASYSGFYWNVSTNKINSYNSGTVGPQHSLPIAQIHRTSGNWDSIEIVFNGFGYMGSTSFVLPGVSVLIPDGRNDDGTLKSTHFTTTAVSTNTETGTGQFDFLINDSGQLVNSVQRMYDATRNIMYGVVSKAIVQECMCGKYTRESGVISNFSINPVFQAVDYSKIGSSCLPTNKYYINLTLGASGTTYIAPDDGWIYIRKQATAASQYIVLIKNFITGSDSTKEADVMWAQAPSDLYVNMPVSKGEIFGVNYTAAGTSANNFFIFVPTNATTNITAVNI